LSMVRAALISVLALGVIAPLPTPSSAQTRGSGLPLPRFVSLRATEVNMRTGPGVQYPVEWVYRRQHLPIEIIAEYGTWRRVRDWQGAQGWVHQSILAGRRTFIVTETARTLRQQQDSQSSPVARLETGVIGRVMSCPIDTPWCKVEVQGREGWLRRVELWGVYRHETIE